MYSRGRADAKGLAGKIPGKRHQGGQTIMSRADELRVRDYLDHILEAIERIGRYVGSMDEVEFQRDHKTQVQGLLNC